VKVTKVSGSLGALIEGVQLSDPSTDFDAVYRALLEHEVVFLHDQHLTPEQQIELGRRFGTPSIFPVAKMMGATDPTPTVIEDTPDSPNVADEWHTDVTWIECPPKLAILSMEVIPEFGGDTLWASATKAFDVLSPRMKALMAGATAVHDNEGFIANLVKKTNNRRHPLVEQLREAYPPVVHPLIRTHPETGRQAIMFAARFLRSIEGFSDDESRWLIDFIHHHVQDPSLHCRWSWRAGDVAIWDERSTLHRAAADHFPQYRRIRRIEVDGDRPYYDPAGRTLAQLG
jgi:taurine dioxygenase